VTTDAVSSSRTKCLNIINLSYLSFRMPVTCLVECNMNLHGKLHVVIATQLYSQQNRGESDRPDNSAEFGFSRHNVCREGGGGGGFHL